MAQKLNTRTSVVDYLKSQNQDSSMSNRATLAQQHGINNYTGSAQQNTKLLSSLRNGGSGTIKEASSAKKAPAPKVNTVTPTSQTSAMQTTNTARPAPTTQAVGSGAMERTDASLEEAMNSYREFLRGNADAHFAEQEAMIGTSLEQQLNRLQKAYDEAVRQGQMSEEEAAEQFEENVGAINDDAYMNSQVTELAGQQRGIQNSQQMMAMQQGDQRHTQSLRDENRQVRDKRVNDIKDRIAQITNEYNLDKNEANTTAELAIRQAQAQADQMFNSGMSQMNLMQYQSHLETKQNLTIQEQQHLNALQQMAQQQDYTQDNMRLDQQFTQDNMNLNQQFTQDNMYLDQKFTQDNMNLQYKIDLGKMKTQHGYDMTKIGTQFQNDLTKMSKQHGYNMSQLNAEQRNALGRINAQMQANVRQAEAQRKAEQASLDRAYNDKSSPEYKIRKAQNDERSELMIQQYYSQAMGQAQGTYEAEKWLDSQFKQDNPVKSSSPNYYMGNNVNKLVNTGSKVKGVADWLGSFKFW